MLCCCAEKPKDEIETTPAPVTIVDDEAKPLPKPEEPVKPVKREEPPPPKPAKGPKMPADFVFKLKDGSKKAVEIRNKPFGVRFSKTSPITVLALQPGGVGEALRIEVGWVLTAINGESCLEKTPEEGQKMISDAIDFLPAK
uniref:PDZ domain-containing protein n=1 Tax=Alexandrium catenella TaxID=2925 RepID=A0A7S1SAU5_ALECA|mmetsp:Transcript_90789/g.241259  ORF Transcript_90789/g.241259 Transcript_90789/m.241259 type:complete len:142 (+) Transcript_90789:84-509(+)